MGEEVGDDPVLPRVLAEPRFLPEIPGVAEPGDQRRVVEAQGDVIGRVLGLDDRRPGRLDRGADPLGPFRQLRPGCPHADPDLPTRLVQAVMVAPDERHREGHPQLVSDQPGDLPRHGVG